MDAYPLRADPMGSTRNFKFDQIDLRLRDLNLTRTKEKKGG